jgi:ABC-type Mn2+/Zn2+ transport system permease subunit
MTILNAFVLPVAMAAAAGLVGCFAVMWRLSLASDALSHVALPGIAIAIALGFNPVLGGLAALLMGTVLIWGLEYRTRLPTDAVIGVIFSAALAIGSMLTSGEELIDALFGGPSRVGVVESVLGIAAAVLVIVFIWRARSRLVIALIARDLARTAGVDVARLDLLFLLAFAVTVALGLRYLGVLLMGSLVIIPGVTARHVASSLTTMLAIAVALAVSATLIGESVSPLLHVAAGPLTIVTAAAFFLVSLIVAPKLHGKLSVS